VRDRVAVVVVNLSFSLLQRTGRGLSSRLDNCNQSLPHLFSRTSAATADPTATRLSLALPSHRMKRLSWSECWLRSGERPCSSGGCKPVVFLASANGKRAELVRSDPVSVVSTFVTEMSRRRDEGLQVTHLLGVQICRSDSSRPRKTPRTARPSSCLSTAGTRVGRPTLRGVLL
jgi:hypothetical protein